MIATPEPSPPEASALPALLFMLAFDHRGDPTELIGEPTEVTLSEFKEIAVEGLLVALGRDDALHAGELALLMDDETGAEPLRRAAARGVFVALPIERRALDELELLPPHDYLALLGSVGADCAKIMVRLDPADPAGSEARLVLVAEAAGRLAAAGVDLMLEPIVPYAPSDERATPSVYAQTVAGYIERCYAAGIRPALWKLAGFDTPLDSAHVARTCLDHDADARCMVLGGSGPRAQVAQWLRNAGRTDGYLGFAIGRAAWREPLARFARGESTREAAADAIADALIAFAETYRGAAHDTEHDTSRSRT